MSMQDLAGKALKLEQQQATGRLIAFLTDATIDTSAAPGRYAYFGELQAQHLALLEALLNNDAARIGSEWSKTLTAHQADMPFLHALTIIYWEMALAQLAPLAKPTTQQAAERVWCIATGLWMMLLSADAFWDYFSRERQANEQGERISLDASQREELCHSMVNELLSLHSSSAKQYFTTGSYEKARTHIRCLDMCRERCKQCFLLLRQNAIPCISNLNERTLDWIAAQAFKMLDEWSVGLIADAEKEASDAGAIKQLPDGIRQNYSGGLRALQPFIDLHIPIMRVLHTALTWYNEWRNDLLLKTMGQEDIEKLPEMAQLQKVGQAAQDVVDQLASISTKGKGFAQENKLLSEHYLLRGFVFDILDKHAEVTRQCEEALVWDPSNDSAQKLREKSRFNLYLQPIIEHIKAERWDQAIQEASAIPKTSIVYEQACLLASLSYFRRGMEALEKKNFERAESDLRKALELNDGENTEALQTIKQFLALTLNARAVQMVEAAPSYNRSDAARKARLLLEDALSIDPDCSSAQKNLAMVRTI